MDRYNFQQGKTRQISPRRFAAVILFCMLIAAGTPEAKAAIHLELRPVSQTVTLGNSISLGLFAVADNPQGELMSAAQVILGWDTTYVQLAGHHQTGAIPLLSSGFFADPYGLNSSLSDGNAMWTGFAFLGQPAMATTAGSLLTTLQFSSLSLTSPGGTLISILPSAGNPLGTTIVYDGTTPNLSVTGTLTGATVFVVPAPGAGALLAALAWPTLRRRRR